MTQYRVIFTAWELVEGSMVRVVRSTKWFDTLAEAQSSKWIKQEGATVISREFIPAICPIFNN